MDANGTPGFIFILFFVPETKRLTLEEMDELFDSKGVAAHEAERMTDINREIGLEDLLARLDFDAPLPKSGSASGSEKGGLKGGTKDEQVEMAAGGGSSSEEDVAAEKKKL